MTRKSVDILARREFLEADCALSRHDFNLKVGVEEVRANERLDTGT